MSSEQEWVVVVQADRQHQHQHQHQQQHQHQVPSDDASLVTAHTSEFTYDFAAEEDDLASSDSVESASALTTAVTRVTSAAAAATATGAVAGAAATGAATQRRKVLPTEALLLHQGVQDRREFFGRWLTQLSVIPHGASGPVVHNIDSFMAVAGALVRTSNGGGDDISDHVRCLCRACPNCTNDACAVPLGSCGPQDGAHKQAIVRCHAPRRLCYYAGPSRSRVDDDDNNSHKQDDEPTRDPVCDARALGDRHQRNAARRHELGDMAVGRKHVCQEILRRRCVQRRH